MIFAEAARPPLQSFLLGPSTVFWVAVDACTVVIRPSSMPNFSCTTWKFWKSLSIHESHRKFLKGRVVQYWVSTENTWLWYLQTGNQQSGLDLCLVQVIGKRLTFYHPELSFHVRNETLSNKCILLSVGNRDFCEHLGESWPNWVGGQAYLGNRGKAIGGAARIGNDCVLGGVVQVFIHPHHKHLGIWRWSRNDDLLCPMLQMGTSL